MQKPTLIIVKAPSNQLLLDLALEVHKRFTSLIRIVELSPQEGVSLNINPNTTPFFEGIIFYDHKGQKRFQRRDFYLDVLKELYYYRQSLTKAEESFVLEIDNQEIQQIIDQGDLANLTKE